jgi:hypothetical protein
MHALFTATLEHCDIAVDVADVLYIDLYVDVVSYQFSC